MDEALVGGAGDCGVDGDAVSVTLEPSFSLFGVVGANADAPLPENAEKAPVVCTGDVSALFV